MAEKSSAQKAKSANRPLSRGKKSAFALLTTMLCFVALEVILGLAGVRPTATVRDPYVGFKSTIPLYVETEQPDGRILLATAENKFGWFNRQQFSKTKPKAAFRIFCLGGSTTYGRPYHDLTSFPGWLRELLPVADPSRTWEVINAGGISYASYRVAALMDELAEYDADLFIVYSGHNEFLEERTYGDIRKPSPWMHVSAALSRTRTWTTLSRLFRRDRPPVNNRFELPGEVDAVLDHTVGPTDYQRNDRLRRQVLEHYELNLARMVQIARAGGARLLFITPASNVKDCSPFKSQHGDKLGKRAFEQWSSLFERGQLFQQSEQLAEAFAAYQQAIEIDDRFAELHYRIGHALFAADRLAEARTEFERAIDEDVCPLRAVTETCRIVAQTAERFDVPLVDFDSLLKNDCLRRYGHNSPGREYFLDHVHPTIETNRLLAVAIIEQLIREGIVANSASGNDATIAEVVKRIEDRIDPQAHAVALRNLAKVLNWAGKHDEAGPLALKALETLPDDPECLFLAAAYLKMTGEVDQAIEYFRKTLMSDPEYAEAHQLLGAALVERGDFQQARVHFSEVLRINPDDADAHHMVGAILAQQEKFAEALLSYREANRLKPNDAHIYYNIAFTLEQLGKREQAIEWYTKTIRLNPEDSEAHNHLGVLLEAANRPVEAINHFREALRIKPEYVEAQRNLEATETSQVVE